MSKIIGALFACIFVTSCVYTNEHCVRKAECLEVEISKCDTRTGQREIDELFVKNEKDMKSPECSNDSWSDEDWILFFLIVLSSS